MGSEIIRINPSKTTELTILLRMVIQRKKKWFLIIQKLFANIAQHADFYDTKHVDFISPTSRITRF